MSAFVGGSGGWGGEGRVPGANSFKFMQFPHLGEILDPPLSYSVDLRLHFYILFARNVSVSINTTNAASMIPETLGSPYCGEFRSSRAIHKLGYP